MKSDEKQLLEDKYQFKTNYIENFVFKCNNKINKS